MTDSVNNAMQRVANSMEREANRVRGLGDKQALQGHTPGPWQTSFSGRFVESASNPDHIVAEVYSQNPEANARLIAAAPEMLEALKAMAAAFSEWEGPEEPETSPAAKARNRCVRVYESARAAIAKAGGR